MFISSNLFKEFSFYVLDTVTQAVPRFCRNKKDPSFCEAFGVVCLLLSSGGKEAREMGNQVCQHPTAMPRVGWGAWGENTHCTLICPPFPRTFWRTACPLGLSIRGLSGTSPQTQQFEKYAQSYLVQNLWTSQISVLMQKRHSLLAFSQGLGQTFLFYLLTPLLRSQVPLQVGITTKRGTWVRTKHPKSWFERKGVVMSLTHSTQVDDGKGQALLRLQFLLPENPPNWHLNVPVPPVLMMYLSKWTRQRDESKVPGWFF